MSLGAVAMETPPSGAVTFRAFNTCGQEQTLDQMLKLQSDADLQGDTNQQTTPNLSNKLLSCVTVIASLHVSNSLAYRTRCHWLFWKGVRGF